MASNAQLRYYQGILEEKNETVRQLGLGKSKHPDGASDVAQLDKLNALAYAAIQKLITVQKIQAKCYDPTKTPKRCR